MPGIGSSSHPTRDAIVEWEYFGDGVVLFHPISKQYFILQSIARRIWELSDGATSVERIVTELAGDFPTSSTRIEMDVRDTVEGLCEFGLLSIEGSEAQP